MVDCCWTISRFLYVVDFHQRLWLCFRIALAEQKPKNCFEACFKKRACAKPNAGPFEVVAPCAISLARPARTGSKSLAPGMNWKMVQPIFLKKTCPVEITRAVLYVQLSRLYLPRHVAGSLTCYHDLNGIFPHWIYFTCSTESAATGQNNGYIERTPGT